MKQLVYFGVNQFLPVSCFNDLSLIACAAKPILDRHLIRGPMDSKPEIVCLSADDEIKRIDHGRRSDEC